MKSIEQIKENMLQVLEENMSHPYISGFSPTAHLIEDLALDSSLILQFMMFLELEHELEMPEDALMKEDFETVDDVAKILFEAQSTHIQSDVT